MYPLVPVAYHSLILAWSANRTDRSIYKPKAVVEVVTHGISILLNSEWIQNGMISGCDSVMMQIVDIVKHSVRCHTQNGNWSCKSVNHVAVTTWIAKPGKEDTKSLYSVENTAFWTLKYGWQLKHVKEMLRAISRL